MSNEHKKDRIKLSNPEISNAIREELQALLLNMEAILNVTCQNVITKCTHIALEQANKKHKEESENDK